MKRVIFSFGLLAASLWLTACDRSQQTSSAAQPPPAASANPAVAEPKTAGQDYYSMILVPHQGTGKTDLAIIRLQQRIALEKNPGPLIEQLGWLFITKARESFDPGYYTLAEACALSLGAKEPHSMEALLLRGHVLQNLHRFKETEPLARELVAKRGLSFDYGLLGDVLMEQGHLSEAVDAYQQMVNQKPDMQAYARISYVRWLKGDFAGATEVMQLAVSAASPNAPEAAAWVNTRMAMLQFQQGAMTEADESCQAALEYQTNYAPALLLRGRMLLANGQNAEAVQVLQQAEKLNSLPDYQWVLSEALREAGDLEAADKIERELMRKGAVTDPRTYALYLATSGNSPAKALQLARNELDTRQDVFTHDAVAWALGANRQAGAAWQEMQLALAEGTQDARLCLHAAVLAAKAGESEASQSWMRKANAMGQMLLPTERRQLQAVAEQMGQMDREDTALVSATENNFIPGH